MGYRQSLAGKHPSETVRPTRPNTDPSDMDEDVVTPLPDVHKGDIPADEVSKPPKKSKGSK